MEEAIFGGGCFWCFEAIFQDLVGVQEVISGYSGGHIKNPTYEQVCGKKTGHAEVVKVVFDPKIVTYSRLLGFFWIAHDPTTLNQQGGDKGPQYRSVIYTFSNKQQKLALESKELIVDSEIYPNPVVTEIEPVLNFFIAEEEHHDYYKRVGANNPYCSYVISPKLNKLKAKFPHIFK